MPVPRPPIQIVKADETILLQLVDAPRTDQSDKMQAYFSKQIARHLTTAGLISKSRSPSCGITDTPIFDSENATVGLGAGYFVRLFRQRFPYIPVIDENQLMDGSHRHLFLQHCFTLARFYQLKHSAKTGALRLFHQQHQLLFQSICPEYENKLASLIAQGQDSEPSEMEYWHILSMLLHMPLRPEPWLLAITRFTDLANNINQPALSKLLDGIQYAANQSEEPLHWYRYLHQLIEKFQLEEILENPLFCPYAPQLLQF